ncbi:TetR/AcrR family transcriptional regulator [Roseibium porphyridii]|uniref:TetR/AcrR family transcriptional regulator n=1 Tax=Roseibium porphyridii TaxID=2866279 RepID=A0ABY8EX57_9HYPH|nr:MULTISPECIES: TetR/AcrR family transcriptional regulator [Stappiaceae]QFT31890.1 HTH-type transcriptional repressor FabR [Labrenzia sp. THAF82]WFE87306.1 TetR/AcrR family transcriptional regulator [Roseibium sp. KMA01]
MAGLQKAKSEETHRRVLEAAISAVEAGGLDAVNIRKIAAEAGYSVGSVYKHFGDQDELLLAVNSVTLGRIREKMSEAIDQADDPVVQMKVLAQTYLDFARANRNLWTTLFAHQLPEDKAVPEEHIQENISLLEFIAVPLKALNPDLEDNFLAARTRTCFAAVHGLVTISLEARFVGLSGEEIDREMMYLVERLSGR